MSTMNTKAANDQDRRIRLIAAIRRVAHVGTERLGSLTEPGPSHGLSPP
ncbi:MAG: hypothetical protein ACI9DC_005285 [Gammaproteobacteria bacterium]|jgi:hypothetical protein